MGLLFALFLPSQLLFCQPLLLLWYTNTATFFSTVTFTFVIAAVSLAMVTGSLFKSSQFLLLFLRIGLVILGKTSLLFKYAVYDR